VSNLQDFLGNVFLLIVYAGAFALAIVMCLGLLGLAGLALRGIKWLVWRCRYVKVRKVR